MVDILAIFSVGFNLARIKRESRLDAQADLHREQDELTKIINETAKVRRSTLAYQVRQIEVQREPVIKITATNPDGVTVKNQRKVIL